MIRGSTLRAEPSPAIRHATELDASRLEESSYGDFSAARRSIANSSAIARRSGSAPIAADAKTAQTANSTGKHRLIRPELFPLD